MKYTLDMRVRIPHPQKVRPFGVTAEPNDGTAGKRRGFQAQASLRSDRGTRVEATALPFGARSSHWIWIPYVWLLLASTRPLSNWLSMAQIQGSVPDPDLSGSPVDRNLMILLIVIAVGVLASRRSRVGEVLRSNKTLLLLFVYILLSIVWSNFPAISFRRSIRSIGTLAVVLVVLTERDPLEAMTVLLRRLYLVIVPLSIVAIKYFRDIGVGYTWDGIEEMWVGLTKDKNNLGQVAVCSGLLCTWQIFSGAPRKQLPGTVFLLGCSLWLLRGSGTSHSSSAIIGYVIGLAGLIALQLVKKRAAQARRVIRRTTIAFALLGPLLYLTFDALELTPSALLLQSAGRDATFSDRTFLWADLLANAEKSPIVGVGFGAFWVGPSGYDLYPLPNWSKVTHTWRPGQGHNGFLDVYVDLGLVGVALAVLVIRAGVASALIDLEHNFERGRLRLILLLTVLINNLTESSLLDGTHCFWYLFLLAAVDLPRSRLLTVSPRVAPVIASTSRFGSRATLRS